jgi:hypothetical protein
VLLRDIRASVEQLNDDARPGVASGPSGFRH